jgi:hypothetical protein
MSQILNKWELAEETVGEDTQDKETQRNKVLEK